MKNKKKNTLLIVKLALIFCLILGCNKEGKPAEVKKGGTNPKHPPLVSLVSPTYPDSGQVREYVGTVESRNQISLAPQITGELVQVYASVGDTVTRGQTLAVVIDPEAEARLNQAKATVAVAQAAVQSAVANASAASEVMQGRQQAVIQADASIAVAKATIAKAKSDLTLAKATLERTKELAARDLIAEQQLDEAQADATSTAADLELGEAKLSSALSEKKQAELGVTAAREQLKAAQAQIASAEANVQSLAEAAKAVAVRNDLSSIRSPINGTVVSRSLDPGAYVSPGNQSTIMVIADTKNLRVAFDLSEADIGLVQPGQEVSLSFDSLPDRLQSGEIIGVAGGLDTASRTIRVEVKLPLTSSNKIRPGMLARIKIAAHAQGLLQIPLPALISDGEEKFVYVLTPDNTVQRKEIKLSGLKGDSALVASGLSKDDKIVVQGVDLVREGSKVEVTATKS